MAKVTRKIKNVVKQYTFAEIKIREATSNDPGGPTPKQLDEIAELSYHAVAVVEILGIIWKRISDGEKHWRHLYKSLIVLDHLVKCGSEKVALYSREKIDLIKQLNNIDLMYEGHDVGTQISVKSKQLVSLLMDKDRLQNERTKMLAAKRMYAKNTGIMSPVLNKVDEKVKAGGRIATTTTRPHSTTPTRHSNKLKSKPSADSYKTDNDDDEEDNDEDDIQLKLALAISKEEHEQEKRLQMNEDLKLRLALEESKALNDNAKKFGGKNWDSVKKCESENEDLLNLSLGDVGDVNRDNNTRDTGICLIGHNSDVTQNRMVRLESNDAHSNTQQQQQHHHNIDNKTLTTNVDKQKPRVTLLSIALSSMSSPPTTATSGDNNNDNDFNLLWDDNAFATSMTTNVAATSSDVNVVDPWAAVFNSGGNNDDTNFHGTSGNGIDPWSEFDMLNDPFSKNPTSPSTNSQFPTIDTTFSTFSDGSTKFHDFSTLPLTMGDLNVNNGWMITKTSSSSMTTATFSTTFATIPATTTTNSTLIISPSNPFLDSMTNATTLNYQQQPATFPYHSAMTNNDFQQLFATNNHQQFNVNTPALTANTNNTNNVDDGKSWEKYFTQQRNDINNFDSSVKFPSTNPFLYKL